MHALPDLMDSTSEGYAASLAMINDEESNSFSWKTAFTVGCMACNCDKDFSAEIESIYEGECNPIEDVLNTTLNACAGEANSPCSPLAPACLMDPSCAYALSSEGQFNTTFSELNTTYPIAQNKFVGCVACACGADAFPSQSVFNQTFQPACEQAVMDTLMSQLTCSAKNDTCLTKLQGCFGSNECKMGLIGLFKEQDPQKQAQLAVQLFQNPQANAVLTCITCQCESDLTALGVSKTLIDTAKGALCLPLLLPDCSGNKCRAQWMPCLQDKPCRESFGSLVQGGGLAALEGLSKNSKASSGIECTVCQCNKEDFDTLPNLAGPVKTLVTNQVCKLKCAKSGGGCQTEYDACMADSTCKPLLQAVLSQGANQTSVAVVRALQNSQAFKLAKCFACENSAACGSELASIVGPVNINLIKAQCTKDEAGKPSNPPTTGPTSAATQTIPFIFAVVAMVLLLF